MEHVSYRTRSGIPKCIKDCRGTILEVGQKVAYNYSGSVAYGEILKITSSVIHIWRFAPHPNGMYTSNNVSKVKRPTGMMVIFEPEDMWQQTREKLDAALVSD